MKNVIVIDVGNTSTSIALACGEKITRFSRIATSFINQNAVVRILKQTASGKNIAGSVLCSVVPSANKIWLLQLKRVLGVSAIIVSHKLKLGIKISYPQPATIGADRLANVCAAVHKYGAPIIVADFGTASTFDVVLPKTGYVGGIISPGLSLMTDYLAEKTALLPRIQIKGRLGNVGKNTTDAMRIGAKIGYRGLIRETVKHLRQGMKCHNLKLCTTGGYANLALDGLDIPFIIDPHLTLIGLSLIYNLNVK